MLAVKEKAIEYYPTLWRRAKGDLCYEQKFYKN